MKKIKNKKFKINDEVVIISGREKNKQTKIIKILPKKNSAILETLNFRTRHQKSSNGIGQKVEKRVPILLCKLSHLDAAKHKDNNTQGKKARMEKK